MSPITLFVLLVAISVSGSLAGVLNNEVDDLWQIVEKDMAKGETHWAVLVAGSDGWFNYRHQADACHAYQVLIKHGFSPDRIITFMTDDIAHNEENPTLGVIINHPNGSDVYAGVKIDYKGRDVTPANFLSVLKGDAQAVQGAGTGRVLKSGPNDHVFVNFVDHGAPGILAFPDSELHASEMMAAINYMHENKMYKQMVFYIEACESGSMFDNLLSADISVFATTASSPSESSYACYYDSLRRTYLGDVYSVKWMEDSDSEDLQSETLEKQFEIVKKETNTSHVEQYGDMKISTEPVADFQGGKTYQQPIVNPLPKVPLTPVRSEEVPLAILGHRLAAASSKQEEIDIMKQIEEITLTHSAVDSTIQHIVAMATENEVQAARALGSPYRSIDFECYEPVARLFDDKCFDLSKHDYAMRRLYALVNLCGMGISKTVIMNAVETICSVN